MSTQKRRIRNQKNIVFEGRTYIVDFDLLKHCSDFFYNSEDDYRDVSNINIPEELHEVNDQSITISLKFIHNDNINEDINESNIFGLRQLCNHYEVPELKELVEDYISRNPNLTFQTILHKFSSNQGNQINADEERDISIHFFDFIDNEQMLTIPIPVMYRILNCYDIQINNLNENDSNRLTEFLFKFLKKNGKSASVLFSTIDIQKTKIELVPTLLNDYSDLFDFNMLNPKLGIKTISDLLNEISELKFNFSSKIEEMNRKIEKQNEDYSILSEQVSRLTNLLNEQIHMQQENESKLNGLNNINQRIQQLETNLNHQNNLIQSNESSLNSKIDSLNSKIESNQRADETRFNQIDAKLNGLNSINQRIQQLETNLNHQNNLIQSNESSLNSKIDLLKTKIESNQRADETRFSQIDAKLNGLNNINQRIQHLETIQSKTFPYNKNNEFSGIFNYLNETTGGSIESVVKVTGSSHNPNDKFINPVNVVYNNEKYFCSDNCQNSWINFDFQKHRVIPTHYTIKTVGNYYPKSWVIEGSNDNESFEVIDTQNNCPFLNGCNRVYTFTISNQDSKSYKYIRMRQTGETWSGSYYLLICTFEIYGQSL